ncbi:MAG: PEP/pyruvate-binding domain-containing protein [Thermoanaerobaculia bacterium]
MNVRQQILDDRRFHSLMPYRVREILLVSSPYDAFTLEEDGQLTEQVFFEYRDVSLSGPPRFTHVSSGEAAFEKLQNQRFDLILVMTSLADMGVNAFGRRVKAIRPGRAVVLLALDRRELDRAKSAIDREAIDQVFLWTGDSQILLAIIKYIEDRENVEHDIQHGNVRVIIMVEDSPRFYSSFLGTLYKELMKQSQSLYSEGVNELHRRMYMRSRPKILHAASYEEAVELFERYKRNLMALICDVRIPRGGELNSEGGIELARFARRYDPELPVLLQSADASNAERAAAMRAAFVNKNSSTLLAEIRGFFRRSLGFGDFVFRLPDGSEVGRARDVRDLERLLAVAPEESLVYHASHQHFSIWLMARSEFELAERLRPRQVSDFPSVEAFRQFLIEALQETHRNVHRGVISDFNRSDFDRDHFSRIDQGSLGGKARGIAFLNQSLARIDPRQFNGLRVKVPKTVVVTTDRFDDFLENGDLNDFAYACDDDRQIARRFLDARLSDDLRSDLAFIAHHIDGPLAIRSSSMLEDSLHQPMAGVYITVMIPNNSRDPEVRLREIASAVKLVYASTFFQNPKAFLSSTGNRVEEEKMAVAIQKLVGRRHGGRYYPSFSGLAQSHNFYPIGPQKAEEGVVNVALGLGRMVVEEGQALRFSPKHPEILPQLFSAKSMLDNTQRGFYALDMEGSCCEPETDLLTNVKCYDLEVAERDGTLQPVGSVYCPDDQRIRDDLSLPGPRIVTFNNLLKHSAIPLAETLSDLLAIAKQGLAAPAEIEFACEMGDWGRPASAGRERLQPELYLLQVRPFGSRATHRELAKLKYEAEEALCASNRSLGHGLEEELRDLIYVRPEHWQAAANKQIADEIGQLNRALQAEGRPYLLIGPGRWGTADPWLGIPVKWSQISSVRVLIEASPEGYAVEPSQGTHFFQNITALQIGYLTLPPGAEKSDGSQEFLDWEWLDEQPAATETRHLRHLRFDTPLTVAIDGRKSRGVILKPRPGPG